MKLKSIHITHFRCIKDQVVSFSDYTCFVGANGSGKSTVLNALNVFFRESKAGSTNLLSLSKEDFFDKDTSQPIRITVTFVELSEEASNDLKDYVRQGQLIVSAKAVWNEDTQTATVTQHGQRLAIQDFAPYFRAQASGDSAAQLRTIYSELRGRFPDLPNVTTKPAMNDALQKYEGARPEQCTLLESGDEFYGVSRGAHKLGKYIQWVFIPAVKDASSEQIETKDTALGRLIDRTVRASVDFDERIKSLRQTTDAAYDEILREKQSSLDALSESLKTRLREWASPSAALQVRWDKDPRKSVQIESPFAKIYAGDSQFLGEIGRHGHGFQRSFMFALLNELAGNDRPNAPRLLLGIEEPELFQHPPQAQHLALVLVKLSTTNAQVFACSHSPYFVSGKGFEDIRLVRRGTTNGSIVEAVSFGDLSAHLSSRLGIEPVRPEGIQAKLNQSLQPSLQEIFFAPKLVLVEGLEDVAYVTSALHLTGSYEEWRKGGGHFVPVNGKSQLIEPLAIAQLFRIPVFVIYDADADVTKPAYQQRHRQDNERLLKLLGLDVINAFPSGTVLGDNYAIWANNIGDTVRSGYEETEWQTWKDEVESELGQPGGLEKNSLLIAGILRRAWQSNRESQTLIDLCDRLIAFVSQ